MISNIKLNKFCSFAISFLLFINLLACAETIIIKDAPKKYLLRETEKGKAEVQEIPLSYYPVDDDAKLSFNFAGGTVDYYVASYPQFNIYRKIGQSYKKINIKGTANTYTEKIIKAFNYNSKYVVTVFNSLVLILEVVNVDSLKLISENQIKIDSDLIPGEKSRLSATITKAMLENNLLYLACEEGFVLCEITNNLKVVILSKIEGISSTGGMLLSDEEYVFKKVDSNILFMDTNKTNALYSIRVKDKENPIIDDQMSFKLFEDYIYYFNNMIIKFSSASNSLLLYKINTNGKFELIYEKKWNDKYDIDRYPCIFIGDKIIIRSGSGSNEKMTLLKISKDQLEVVKEIIIGREIDFIAPYSIYEKYAVIILDGRYYIYQIDDLKQMAAITNTEVKSAVKYYFLKNKLILDENGTVVDDSKIIEVFDIHNVQEPILEKRIIISEKRATPEILLDTKKASDKILIEVYKDQPK